MTKHSITPPSELVDKWVAMLEYCENIDVFTDVARWGADQELKACCKWASQFNYDDYRYQDELQSFRRPKPPSLKEQALKALQDQIDTAFMLSPEAEERADLIRRALEQLDD